MNYRCALIVTSLLLSAHAHSSDLNLLGGIDQTIPLIAHDTLQKPNNMKTIGSKQIKLLHVQLSSQAQKNIAQRLNAIDTHPNQPSNSSLPSTIQLAMNKVPVLDQGMFGSCVTFAVTGALDAALGQGDYISQLCSLQLGLEFEQQGYRMSGWSGSFGSYVLSQLQSFGIINKANQKQYGCGGYKNYPSFLQPVKGMSLSDYRQYSENLANDGPIYSTIIDANQAFNDGVDMDNSLDQVKKALNRGHRVNFGVLLPRVELGVAGAQGWHHYVKDSWVISWDIKKYVTSKELISAGHEMIITGYDDGAVAMDNFGVRHFGLLTLRNSWGSRVGDYGDFYMSYDYFKAFAMEAHEIIL